MKTAKPQPRLKQVLQQGRGWTKAYELGLLKLESACKSPGKLVKIYSD